MTPAPFYADIAEGPDSGAAWWLTTRDGVRIRMGHWPGGDRGTVLIFPGRTEMVEKYGRTAAQLVARGYCPVAIDWRGQGIADRLTDNPHVGHADRFSDYQLDVAAVLKGLGKMASPKPYFLIGHSMGGAIGLRALARGLNVRAACFSAPMWGIRISALKRPQAWMAARLAIKLGYADRYIPGTYAECYVATTPFEGNELTTDPDMFDYMKRQLAARPELSLGGASLGWLYEALTECRRFRDMALPDMPVLAWLGSDERIVNPPCIHRLMARWPGARLKMLDGARHEPLFEAPDIRNRVLDETCAFFAAHS